MHTNQYHINSNATQTWTNLKVEQFASRNDASVLVHEEAAFLIASGDVINEWWAAEGADRGHMSSSFGILHYL